MRFDLSQKLNSLRNFVKLPPRQFDLESYEITDEELAESAFGRQSNIAKKILNI